MPPSRTEGPGAPSCEQFQTVPWNSETRYPGLAQGCERGLSPASHVCGRGFMPVAPTKTPQLYGGAVRAVARVPCTEVGHTPGTPPNKVHASATPVPAHHGRSLEGRARWPHRVSSPHLTHPRQTDKGKEAGIPPTVASVGRALHLPCPHRQAFCLPETAAPDPTATSHPRTRLPPPILMRLLGGPDQLQDRRASRRDLPLGEPRPHGLAGWHPLRMGLPLRSDGL